MSLSILIADDHSLIRQGIRSVLARDPDLTVVAEATDGIEAVTMAEQTRPDVAIIDISMKQMNGIDVISQVAKLCPDTRIVVLSMFADERYVNRSLRAGAHAYVLKDSSDDDLLKAIHAVRSGQSYFSPVIAKVLLDNFSRGINRSDSDDRYDQLTDREREVYHMLAEGKTNKMIAGSLGLSIHTVETHRIRIMGKLGVHNTAELVLSAVRRGLVT